MSRLIVLDRRLTAHLAIPSHARILRLLALVTAHSGDSLLWLTGAIAAIVWGNAQWQGWGGRALIGTIAAGAAATALKMLFRRRRPAGDKGSLYSGLDLHAFPSGHACRTACIVVLLLPVLPAWSVVFLTSWTVAVGLARVALQVHYASDIVGGWLTGIAIGAALLQTL